MRFNSAFKGLNLEFFKHIRTFIVYKYGQFIEDAEVTILYFEMYERL
jgi:hypothetical protein